MKSNFAFEYLKINKRFKNLKTFVKELFSLQLVFCEVDGRIISAGNPDQLQYIKNKSQLKNNYDCTDGQHQWICSDMIQKVLEGKKLEIFLRSVDHRQIILIPIIVKREVEGFLYLEESEVCRLKPGQAQVIAVFVKESLDSIIREELMRVRDFNGGKKTHQQKLINRVLCYIKENYSEHTLSLNEISEQTHVSYYYLSHLFKQEKQISFSKYLTHLRVEIASRMLKDQSLTVSEVSRFCGFEDPGYFCKVFKREVGCPPISYQKKRSKHE